MMGLFGGGVAGALGMIFHWQTHTSSLEKQAQEGGGAWARYFTAPLRRALGGFNSLREGKWGALGMQTGEEIGVAAEEGLASLQVADGGSNAVDRIERGVARLQGRGARSPRQRGKATRQQCKRRQ